MTQREYSSGTAAVLQQVARKRGAEAFALGQDCRPEGRISDLERRAYIAGYVSEMAKTIRQHGITQTVDDWGPILESGDDRP